MAADDSVVPASSAGDGFEQAASELADTPAGEPSVVVVEARTLHGEQRRPLALEAFALVDRDPDGRYGRHLEASGPRVAIDARTGVEDVPDALHAEFEVRWGAPRTSGR